MSVVSAIHASAAVLLVVAGVAKLVPPADGFAGLVGLRARPSLLRILGGAEVAAGAGALWLGGPVAASAVGLLYGAFAVVVLRALLTGAESCGCFGRLDAPPSWVHVLGNLALAGVSFAAAGTGIAPVQAVVQSLSDDPAVGAALAAEIVLVAGLGLVAFTALPEALGARTARHGDGPLFRAVKTRDGPLFRAVKTRDGLLFRAVKTRDGLLFRAVKTRDGLLFRAVKTRDGTRLRATPPPASKPATVTSSGSRR